MKLPWDKQEESLPLYYLPRYQESSYIEQLQRDALEHCWLTRKRPVAVRLGIREAGRLDTEAFLHSLRFDDVLGMRKNPLDPDMKIKHVSAITDMITGGQIAIERVDFPEHLEWVDEP